MENHKQYPGKPGYLTQGTAVVLFTILLLTAFMAGGCSRSKPEPVAPFAIQEVDMEGALAFGLPVILCFGEKDSEMTEILRTFHQDFGDKAVIQFIDIDEYPTAKEGYPIQTIPSMMLFTEEGEPFDPGFSFDFVLNRFYDFNTGELAFTIREGALTKEETGFLFDKMGIVKKP